MPRRPRSLRPEERELWQAVARTARPLNPDAPRPAPPDILPPAPEPSAPKPAAKPRPQPIPAFRIGAVPSQTIPQTAQRPAPEQALRMDSRAFSAMTKGRLRPEARLDLHGHTLDQAQGELTRFILKSHAAGRRLVLVITGKGRIRDEGGPIPTRPGALRHQVPHWLARPPLSPLVLQTAPAHLRHGGEGALYVYLRRR